MVGSDEKAGQAWKRALPVPRVPLYLKQEKQHNQAHTNKAHWLKLALYQI